MKHIFRIIIGLWICQIGWAQDKTFQDEWAFGVNGGVTLSKVSFFPSVPQDLLLLSTGGLTARYISEKNFGIQAELNYSLRGWKERTDTVVHLNKYSRALVYLELPIMTQLYFDMGKRARIVINAGPQVGYNIGEKVIEKILVMSPGETSEEFMQNSQYYDQKIQHFFDYGITAGLGFELRTGIGSFILDGRYYFGLSDVFSNKKSDVFQSSSNQVIGVKMTYLFRTK